MRLALLSEFGNAREGQLRALLGPVNLLLLLFIKLLGFPVSLSEKLAELSHLIQKGVIGGVVGGVGEWG